MDGLIAQALLAPLALTATVLLLGGVVAMARPSLRRRLAPVLLGLGGAAAVAAFATWRVIPIRPTVTCDLPSPAPCEDTADSIEFDPDFVFYPRLPGPVWAIEVRTPPAEWADSLHEGYRVAEWATLLHYDNGPPILAACYYSSDRMVFCHTSEELR
jgi:hypothetical protein